MAKAVSEGYVKVKPGKTSTKVCNNSAATV
jgi:hypothetical protein